jgi:outer membrane protein insertion porin family
MINDTEFELIYNINAGNKVYFNELSISYPVDFNEINYQKLNELLVNLNGKPYSINSVEKILNEIDQITINEEFKSITANIDEKILEDKIDIKFIIKETESYVVERINIFGNNVTRESVIRNQLIIDEGDPFNEILAKKSENNLKSLNFFKNVKSEIVEGEIEKSKIINIYVEEKPTGEIAAGAGVGTAGGTISAGVKENNYLGKGLAVEANATITPETIKGLFSISNPNYNNSDKLVFFNAQAIEIDRLKNNGYKTNKTGFELGTEFEYLDNLSFGIATSNFFEKIETNSTASTRQKAQKGNYFDAFVKFDFFYDKRNQKFRPTDGFYSKYDLDVPLISDNNTLTNSYDLKFFNELYENNVTSFSILLKAANSITGDDIKLTERLIIPSNRLRGFEPGKVGPKDGNDFIGGNYVTAINFNTTLPQILPNMQNLDSSIFIDAANIWGIDYDSSLSDTNKIRSSIGIGVDWFTVLGPLSFSLSEVIAKEDSDIEESFRFRLGTTF